MADLVVEAYSGYKGEETPRVFTHEGIRRQILQIIARWYTEQHSYFRVRTDEGDVYVLRYDLENVAWEIVMQETNRKGDR